jgi:hypothetical protein
MDPHEFHKKPAGHRGPCPVCGCPAKRLRAQHRALPGGGWTKVIKVCFGLDWTEVTFGTSEWRE